MLVIAGKRNTVQVMKDSDFDVLHVSREDRALIKQCADNAYLNQFLKDIMGFTMTQFKATITAEQAQNLLKMGLYVKGKPTATNYKQELGTLLEEKPFLRHRDPVVCLAKILYYKKCKPIEVSDEDDSGADDE